MHENVIGILFKMLFNFEKEKDILNLKYLNPSDSKSASHSV